MPEGAAGESGRLRVLAADVVRLVAWIWSGCCLYWAKRKQDAPAMIYERVAVMQNLTAFHPARSKAPRVVESNGLMARETQLDRNALVLAGIARRLEKRCYAHADLVVAVSQPLKDAISEEFSIDKEKILVVPNAIPQKVVELRRAVSNDLIIGFVGSVVAWQQLDILIRAFARVRKRDGVPPNVRVEIIGSGPELPALIDLVESLDLAESVTLFGSLPQDEALTRMTRWALGYSGHAASSHTDMYHSPLKLYEYAGLGLSIVATPSQDAECLVASGARIHQFSSSDDLDAALVEAISTYASLSPSEVEESRKKTIAEHSWEARVRSVLVSLHV
ncbi:glycosyltransferase [Rhodococcus pyridinivorans]|uniref:glycosyltransferase n=1 Tax=Rhodococcus pyridinivorans TaxID=103816 RepID=UPI0009BFD471|nr:glycosyltransferase [Rhodococcus pyridinivorans]